MAVPARCCAKSVLTLSRDYFRLRKPLERRVYELARKHCGRQPEWRIGLRSCKTRRARMRRCGCSVPAIREMIEGDHLPDYSLVEDRAM